MQRWLLLADRGSRFDTRARGEREYVGLIITTGDGQKKTTSSHAYGALPDGGFVLLHFPFFFFVLVMLAAAFPTFPLHEP